MKICVTFTSRIILSFYLFSFLMKFCQNCVEDHFRTRRTCVPRHLTLSGICEKYSRNIFINLSFFFIYIINLIVLAREYFFLILKTQAPAIMTLSLGAQSNLWPSEGHGGPWSGGDQMTQQQLTWRFDFIKYF